MSNTLLIQVAVNIITAEVFLLFCLSLVILNKTKSMAQRAFMAWIVSLAVLGMTGAAWLTTTSADTALLVGRMHYSILLLGAVLLWIFAITFKRDISPRDMAYLFPALIIMPILWTLTLTGVKYSATGWEPVSTAWFEGYFAILFGYYVAALVNLAQAFFAVKKTGETVPIRRLRIIVLSVAALILIGAMVPVASRIFQSAWLTLAINIAYIFPPLFMAWSFQIEDKHPRL